MESRAFSSKVKGKRELCAESEFEEEEEMGFGEDDKKKKGMISRSGGVALPSCQAEQCTADLTDAKRYYRRHKVCEHHSKAPVVLVGGLRQRFCQQCSRFSNFSIYYHSFIHSPYFFNIQSELL